MKYYFALLLASLASHTSAIRHHHRRHRHPIVRMNESIASWYYDAGSTASGTHYTNGFAALIFGSEWGKKVLFCYQRCAVGYLDDHGPYVGGRTFDLNQNLAGAIGFSGVGTVRWRVL